MKDYEKILAKYKDLVRECNGNYAAMYDRVSNNIYDMAEGDTDDEKYEILLGVQDVIKDTIVQKYMNDNGYVLHNEGGIPRYERG